MRKLVGVLILLAVMRVCAEPAKPDAPPPLGDLVRFKMLQPAQKQKVMAGRSATVQYGMEDPAQLVRRVEVALLAAGDVVVSRTAPSEVRSTWTGDLKVPSNVQPGPYQVVVWLYGDDAAPLREQKIPVEIVAAPLRLGWVSPSNGLRVYPGRTFEAVVTVEDPGRRLKALVFRTSSDSKPVRLEAGKPDQRWAANLTVSPKAEAGKAAVTVEAIGLTDDGSEGVVTTLKQDFEILPGKVAVAFQEPLPNNAILIGKTLIVRPALQDPARRVNRFKVEIRDANAAVLMSAEEKVPGDNDWAMQFPIALNVPPGKYSVVLTAHGEGAEALATSTVPIEIRGYSLKP